MNRYTVICFLAGVLFSIYNPQAATYTVSKNGSGQFTSVQAAINAAGADGSGVGDEVVILDYATYEEQVTIDSTCSGLTIRSSNPESVRKPVIQYKDTINIKPTTYQESLDLQLSIMTRMVH